MAHPSTAFPPSSGTISRRWANAHIVGRDTFDGASTAVVATFGNRADTPIWFRFWVDATRRVRQVYMDAPGHFMVDHYLSFNAPVAIGPPMPA